MRPGLFSVLVLLASSAGAQTSLQLKWEVKEHVFGDKGAASRAAFTLTNRDVKPLASRGWAIYFSALHEPRPGSVQGGVTIEAVTGDFQRIVPKADFPGVAPGQTVEFEYLTSPLSNVSFAPAGPYIVFDDAPRKGYPLKDYVALPFSRPKPPGLDPRLTRQEALSALDEAVRDIPLADLPPVFPTPITVEKRVGQLRLDTLPSVQAAPELKAEAEVAAEYLRPYFAKGGPASPTVAVRLETGLVPGAASPEAYEMVVDPREGVRIVGNSAAGVFHGLQSLRSLLPVDASAAGLTLPALRVVDAPRFVYRGLMLDVARNFQPKATVLRAIDLMARYKLNALHLHLTDDEGWRVEIPSLPELTSVGSRRGHTLDSSAHLPPAWGSGPEVDRPFGSGFYSRSEYGEILKYAAARHIEVIPEIEMPGHARAAIKAMEARFRTLTEAGDPGGAQRFLLSEKSDRSSYTSAQLYHDNVMNVALPSTYAFIERVVGDLVTLHRDAGVPLLHLHMGGDEVPAGVWEGSPAAQAYLKEHHLETVDDLWFVFYGRVEQILKAHGLPLSGWEEIGVRKARINGRATNVPNLDFADRGWRAYVWNNVPGWGAEDLAYRMANSGYKVVFCPVSNLYFDMAANINPDEPGLHWGGYVDVNKPFEFIPLDYYRNVREDSSG
ncbi:MAG TPA: family 20 glycosylhydrolase, partial [Vicinamibacteria bacterium]|nr:family 20 glycosylhydrolase [Vicinamibacteria bacterium]